MNTYNHKHHHSHLRFYFSDENDEPQQAENEQKTTKQTKTPEASTTNKNIHDSEQISIDESSWQADILPNWSEGV